jgi:hypothetical protein
LAKIESRLVQDQTDQSAWEEMNTLFGPDGPIADCLHHLSKSAGHDALSMDEALTLLKAQFLAHAIKNSTTDTVRKACDELDAVHQNTVDFAASIRTRKLVGYLLDLGPVLSALDDFSRTVEAKRRQMGGDKRGPKTGRAFVHAVIQVVEMYIGGKVGMGKKGGTPADTVRRIVSITDPRIGDGTLEEALKARSKEIAAIAAKA